MEKGDPRGAVAKVWMDRWRDGWKEEGMGLTPMGTGGVSNRQTGGSHGTDSNGEKKECRETQGAGTHGQEEVTGLTPVGTGGVQRQTD